MLKPAPITLFTYNRLAHTVRTVEALQRNAMASESDLIVFSDAPKHSRHNEAVRQIRGYLKTVKGFRQVTIVERDANYGLARSIIAGVSETVGAYGRIIVLEDDMETSPWFLTFMNEALEYYCDDERVASIHGYTHPLKAHLPETFFIKDTGCWGWATWKRGWDLFEADGKRLLCELRRRNLTSQFDLNGSYPFTKMLADQTEGKNDSWAIRWQASVFLNDRLTLFPGRSLVRNIGYDGSGVNCEDSDTFDVKLSETPVAVGAIPVEENALVLKALEGFFRSLRHPRIKSLLRKMKKACRLGTGS